MERFLLSPAVVWVLIPITFVIMAGVKEIYHRYCLHQERIAMIENGMHPDDLESKDPTDLKETAPYTHTHQSV